VCRAFSSPAPSHVRRHRNVRAPAAPFPRRTGGDRRAHGQRGALMKVWSSSATAPAPMSVMVRAMSALNSRAGGPLHARLRHRAHRGTAVRPCTTTHQRRSPSRCRSRDALRRRMRSRCVHRSHPRRERGARTDSVHRRAAGRHGLDRITPSTPRSAASTASSTHCTPFTRIFPSHTERSQSTSSHDNEGSNCELTYDESVTGEAPSPTDRPTTLAKRIGSLRRNASVQRGCSAPSTTVEARSSEAARTLAARRARAGRARPCRR
jgi:hypothetical protein